MSEPHFTAFDRQTWSRSESATFEVPEVHLGLSELTAAVAPAELEEVYGPLVHLLELHRKSARELACCTGALLGHGRPPAPFVVAVAGSVAVGKSTSAEILRRLLSRLPDRPRVDLVSTDGFLFPNHVLESRNLMTRKGFPESYDIESLLRFLAAVKGGEPEARAPRYSHRTYDVLDDGGQRIRRPDVLVIEGVNVLQTRPGPCPSDFVDFSLFVDAPPEVVRRWYVRRFLGLQRSGARDPESYFHRFAHLDPEGARELAENIWDEINGPNLEQHIAPTRARADLVLEKDEHHAVRRVLLRSA